MGCPRLLFPCFLFFIAALPASASNWKLTAGLQVQEMYSDNIFLAGPGLERGELVTQLNPGLHLSGQGARLKANVDAVWQVMNYANGSSGTRVSPTMSGTGSLELVEKWFYVDGLASVSQQSLSPFGPQLTQATQAANINANSSRVTNYVLTPRISGVVGSDLAYETQYRLSQSSTAGTALGTNSRSEDWSGSLRWGNSTRLFNLAARFSTSDTRYTNNQASSQNRMSRLYGYFNPDAHLSLWANVGRETGNALQNRLGSTRGIGFKWEPGPRTTVSGQRDLRYFGANDSFSLNHRFRRAALNVNYSRDRTSSQGLLTQNAVSTNYQILFTSLTAAVPDPVQRDLLVTQLLQAQGLSPNATPLIGFLSDSIMIRRALNVSFAIIGVRNTVTFMASRNETTSDMVPMAADIFGSYSVVLQNTMGLTWNYRLSPYSTFTASLSNTSSSGTGTVGLGASSRQSTTNLLWNSQIGPHSVGSLGLRRVSASGTAAGTGNYRENAGTATFGYTY